MALIEQRGSSWRVRIRRKGYAPQTKTFDRKADAEAWARQIETEMDRGDFVSRAEAERTTLAMALDRYEREFTSQKKGALQERTRIRWWKKQPLAHRPLASIRSSDLAAYRDQRLQTRVTRGGKVKDSTISPHTVRLELALISNLFTVARTEWGMESLGNPAKIKKPKLPKGRDRRLEGDEEKRLLAAARHSDCQWLAPVISFAIETAMRQGEILSLRWRGVNLDDRVAHLADTKNGEHRDVPLSSRAVELLRSIPRAIDGRVFPVSAGTLSEKFRAACELAGIEGLRFHDLRHEATSRFFEGGNLEIMDVAHITGHKTLQMLKRYTHMRTKRIAERLG